MPLETPLSRTLRTTKTHLDRLSTLGVKTVKDFLLFFPRAYQDKRTYTKVAELIPDELANVKGVISNIFHKRTKTGKMFTKAVLTDDTGSIEAVWFNQPYLKRVLKAGQELVLSGKCKFGFGRLSLQSPLFEEPQHSEDEELTHVGRIVPVYHQTEGITSKWIREKLKPLIDEWTDMLPEYVPQSIIDELKLMPYGAAVKEAHFPTDEEKLEEAKKRLSFDELFLLQFKALQKKWRWQNIDVHEQKPMAHHTEIETFIAALPYELTGAQQKTLNEILEDLGKPFPMSRLVQGDVGSGKTVVAAAAMLNTMKHGYQTALMAPTEILARQHYHTLFKLLKPYGYNIQFVSGSVNQSQKDEIIRQLNSGTLDLVVGTHSLIQEGVKFKNLGLAVIDEQHRFGVKQRDILKSNNSPHLLSLSATPIPRTLAMTVYGDQDLSVIDEMPKGRQEIITRIVPEKKRTDAYRWIENQILKGRQAFVICPLIDESDVLEVKSAIQEFEYLKEHIFPNLKLGLLHGKMKANDKEEIMNLFQTNEIQILVSTSVIEVGIDVPNASIMMIEGAERFGLSQLHQFRGRVGRGEHQSYCFLFNQKDSEDSRTRLQAMVKYSSGFKLAEIDLTLRGPGEIFGVRQSGIPDLKMASLTDSITINLAREAAQKLLNQDPQLKTFPLLKQKLEELDEVYVND